MNRALSRKVWILLISLVSILGAAWIWLTRPTATNSAGEKISAPQRGFLAPDFELSDSTGQTYRVSELRGRPLLINFWASWCTPCRAEMPAMERVYQKYRDRGFLILGVNSTIQDNRRDALTFSDGLQLSFPILFDDQGEASDLFAVRALPTSFFVAPDGTIEEVVIGGPMAEALLNIRVQQLVEGNP